MGTTTAWDSFYELLGRQGSQGQGLDEQPQESLSQGQGLDVLHGEEQVWSQAQ